MIHNWLVGVLGLLLVGVAFIGLSGVTLTRTLIVMGLVIASIGFWDAIVNEKTFNRKANS